MEEVKVTRKYQITIPKEIRMKLGIKIGDNLLLKKEENGIFIQVPTKISDPSQFLWNLTKKPIDIDAVKLVEESWDLNISVEVLKDIRDELRELRLLYEQLVEKFIPTEKPTLEEEKAIEEKDEIVNEKELMKID